LFNWPVDHLFSQNLRRHTLPVTIKSLTDRARISEKIASFVPPLGATVGMNGGSSIYPALVAI